MGNSYGVGSKYPIIAASSVMRQRSHGTSDKPAQTNLRFGCDFETADKICSFNRHYAEHSGYAFGRSRSWVSTIKNDTEPRIYYDSVTGKPLFKAPVGRSID